MRQIFNKIIKRNEFTPEDWKKVKIKVIYNKRRRGKCEQLPPDLLIASDVQTFLDDIVWKIIPNARPKTSGR